MWLFDFLTTFSFDYICFSTVTYLIFLELSKPYDLKEWFDKKIEHAIQPTDFCTFRSTCYLCLSYLFVNNWLGKRILR